MRACMRRHLARLLLAAVTYKATLLCVPFVDFEVGRAEARWDAWNGRRQFRRPTGRCVDFEATRRWERMLAGRFGFKTLPVEDDSRRVNGYNVFQQGEFDRLFGAGAFKSEVDDFRRQWLRGFAKEER